MKVILVMWLYNKVIMSRTRLIGVGLVFLKFLLYAPIRLKQLASIILPQPIKCCGR